MAHGKITPPTTDSREEPLTISSKLSGQNPLMPNSDLVFGFDAYMV